MFTKNPKFASAVIVTSGTMEFEDALREWKPEREYYCKRKCSWLSKDAAEETEKFVGMT